MRTILLFAGTRPEIIKMAPVLRELRARQSSQRAKSDAWKVHFCFSGQHDELAEPFLKFFNLEVDSQLDLMESGQSLGQLAARAMGQLDHFFESHAEASAALVQGDTTTAFVAALTAFYHKVPVGHVEAGLRTSTIDEPFPEELNRRLITRVARWHYAPTEKAKTALVNEGIAPESIIITQNTGIDSFLWASSQLQEPNRKDLAALTGKRLVLITAHRRENIGAPLERITAAVTELAREFADVQFVFPVHRNPDVAGIVRRSLANIGNILLIEPLEYPDLTWTMKNAELIMTDSGGIQEEGPSVRKPVLVLRNETERVEAVDFGTSFVVGSDQARIVTTAREFLTGNRKLALKGTPNPYGDGRAASRIAEHLLSQLRFSDG